MCNNSPIELGCPENESIETLKMLCLLLSCAKTETERVEGSVDCVEVTPVRVYGAVHRTDLGCSSKQSNEELESVLTPRDM